MPNMSKQYQLILGTFIDNEFIWHDIDSFDTLEEGYKEFKKYVNSQLKYTDEELVKVWNSGRLDIELRRGNRLLNWVGIYVREVDKLSEEEEEEADKENPEKKSTKDSLDIDPKYHGDIFVFWPDKKVTKKSIDVYYDGGKNDPEARLFKRATKIAQSAADNISPVYWHDCNIYMHATVDGEPLFDGYEYYKYHEGINGTWEPVDNMPDPGPSWRDSTPENKYYVLHYSRFNTNWNDDTPDDIREFGSLEQAKRDLAEKKSRASKTRGWEPIMETDTNLVIIDAETGEVEHIYFIANQKQLDKRMNKRTNDAVQFDDYLIEWDTNQDWFDHLTDEQRKKLFTTGLYVKRHLTFHAFGEEISVDREKDIIHPYEKSFSEWLKEPCTLFEGEW